MPVEPKGELKPFNPGANRKPFNPSFNPVPFVDEDQKIENTINDIVKTSRRNISDGERDMLRDLLKNPKLTPDQAKESIQTLQGYHPKQRDNTITTPDYYVKLDNGVLRPLPLGYGEKPPKGYEVESIWGTQKEANDDSWYTDAAKSLYNGVIGAVGGVTDLANLGVLAATGEESQALTAAKQSTKALKFKKDEELNTPLYKTDNIEKWEDVFQKDRFDLSPKALWGTLNMAAESVTEFLVGAKGAATIIKGAKTGLNALKGIDDAVELGKGAQRASAFTGSFMAQLGDNIDNAKEAGLKGRDVAAFATGVTSVQAIIDAALGLESKIFYSSYRKSQNELIKQLAKNVEKDAQGKITEQGFKELARHTAFNYGKLAKVGAKEITKDAFREMSQETLQDFTAKAGENLWDKMTPDERGKFGTDATSPKSFGSYIQNAMAGLISGGPMAVVSTNYKKKYDEQSINAFDLVKQGKDKVDEFKANIYAAERGGKLTEKERDQAVFKIDQYNKYWEQTKDFPGMTDEEKRKAFELSFNIEGLKSEIPKETEGLDPVAIAKVENKKRLIKDLQLELNHILLKQDIQKESRVGQKTVDQVVKSEEPKEGQIGLNELIEKLKPKVEKPEGGFVDLKKKRPPLDEVDVETWNDNNKTTSLQRKQILQEHLKTTPGNEIEATLQEGENGTIIAVLPDGKKIHTAQSAKANTEGADEFIKRGNLPATQEYGKVKDRGGNAQLNQEGKPLFSYKEPVAIKRVEIQEYDADGNKARKEDGTLKKKAVLSIYNKQTGGHIIFARERDPWHGGKKYKTKKYHPKEQQQIDEIREINHLSDDIAPYSVGSTSQPEFDTVDKPKLKISPMEDVSILKQKYSREQKRTKSGDVVTVNVSVGKKQGKLEAEFKRLEKLIDCLWS